MSNAWENSIIITGTKTEFKTLQPVAYYAPKETTPHPELELPADITKYIQKDVAPLPVTEDREGYHGDEHYEHWLSGLSDYVKIVAAAKSSGLQLNSKSRVLDFGCASGRVLRHFAAQSEVQAWGCDISENHVVWCNQYLPDKVKVFQNTSLPHIQVEDNFFDVIYAMSVFTHIESFETSWLCELYRALKPRGIAYVTIHDETSWKDMPLDWGAGFAVTKHPDFKKEWLKAGFPGEKFVSRWHDDKSYSSNVFYKLEYIKRVWGKFFTIKKVIPKGSAYQTVVILQKT